MILFDEVEKAHADVFNILLQILDDGHVTDSQGRKVSFKNAILIMTSNMGSQYIVAGMEKDPQAVKDMVMSQVHPLALLSFADATLAHGHVACPQGKRCQDLPSSPC